ncbi:MAG: hypothetical protein HY906_03590, partial [Deltaproteobacteria bacterium]|nr:hypothetical protein [Deltaproteobacteria bacterium]
MKRLALLTAVLVPTVVFGQITASKHDFSLTTGPAASWRSTTNTQLCIFCHTPHSAIQQSLLWNHTASAENPVFTAANTNDGTALPTTIPATSPSRRCLSCHDGSVAI